MLTNLEIGEEHGDGQGLGERGAAVGRERGSLKDGDGEFEALEQKTRGAS